MKVMVDRLVAPAAIPWKVVHVAPLKLVDGELPGATNSTPLGTVKVSVVPSAVGVVRHQVNATGGRETPSCMLNGSVYGCTAARGNVSAAALQALCCQVVRPARGFETADSAPVNAMLACETLTSILHRKSYKF